jgi:hypothetical protein
METTKNIYIDVASKRLMCILNLGQFAKMWALWGQKSIRDLAYQEYSSNVFDLSYAFNGNNADELC